jgi:hypothetical protein
MYGTLELTEIRTGKKNLSPEGRDSIGRKSSRFEPMNLTIIRWKGGSPLLS